MRCVIVGGGVAGLMAAKELAAKNWDVTIVESRPRLGGRVLTVQSQGLPIDLGPEFIHGTPSEIESLLSDPKNQIRPLEELETMFWQGEIHALPNFWKIIDQFENRYSKYPPDRTVAELLRKYEAPAFDKALIGNFIEGINASDSTKQSMNAMAEENSRAPADLMDPFRLLTGYDFVVRTLEQQLRALKVQIQLSARASKIEWRAGQAYVTVVRGGVEGREPARAVLLTIPSGHYTLPEESPHSIAFSPEIWLHRMAAEKLPMGPVHKMVLIFNEPLWPKAAADVQFIHSPELTFGTRWSWNWTRANVITAWSAGTRANRLTGLTAEQILEICLSDLATVTNMKVARVRENLSEWHYHDWVRDPHSQGAYSYVTINGAGSREQLAKPIEETLFFAGEATDADGSAGTVHGALRSGVRAAREILQIRS